MTDTDILIIGAGMAGVSVAAELAGSHRVQLWEREEHPGLHATGRSAAIYSETYGPSPVRALTRASRDFLFAGGGQSGPIFVTPRFILHLATAEQITVLDALHAQPDIAANCRRIGGAEAERIVPALRPGAVAAALLDPYGFDMDVHAIHQHYLHELRRLDGQMLCDRPLDALQWSGDHWIARSGDMAVTARIIVNAAGAWADPVACMAGLAPLGIIPKRRTAVLVDPPPGQDIADWPMTIDCEERFYFKPDAGKLLLSPADATPSEPCDAQPEEIDIAIAVDRVQQVADIPVRRVSHSWAGLRSFAADGVPVAGFDPDHPAFFWLAGQGGYGIQTAPALARMAAALLRGDAIPQDIEAQGLRSKDIAPGRLRTAALATQ